MPDEATGQIAKEKGDFEGVEDIQIIATAALGRTRLSAEQQQADAADALAADEWMKRHGYKW